MNKLHNGSIYRYGHRVVRLHNKVGAISVLRAINGKIFRGRSNLLTPASTAEVEEFRRVARQRAAATK